MIDYSNFEKFVLNEVDFWTKCLQLTGWTIAIKIDEILDHMGEIEYCFQRKEALLKLNPLDHYKTLPWMITDKESNSNYSVENQIRKTIVHELLHLKLHLMDDGSEITHQILDDLARAFIYANTPYQKRGVFILQGDVEEDEKSNN